METEDLLPPELRGSSLEPEFRALNAIYSRVETETSRFQMEAQTRFAASGGHFGCPHGCGSCCERFVPDILPVEADYAALWIMRHAPDLASVEGGSGPACPYYDPDRPEAHCRIYGGRPLICRLFGWAAVVGKDGAPAYSLCWKMTGPAGREERSWSGARLAETFGTEPPLMAPYGFAVESLAGSLPGGKRLIGEAVGDSLRRLGFLLSLSRLAS